MQSTPSSSFLYLLSSSSLRPYTFSLIHSLPFIFVLCFYSILSFIHFLSSVLFYFFRPFFFPSFSLFFLFLSFSHMYQATGSTIETRNRQSLLQVFLFKDNCEGSGLNSTESFQDSHSTNYIRNPNFIIFFFSYRNPSSFLSSSFRALGKASLPDHDSTHDYPRPYTVFHGPPRPSTALFGSPQLLHMEKRARSV